MQNFPLLPALLALCLTAACTQAQPDEAASAAQAGSRQRDKAAAAAVPGLTNVGSLKGVVPESSGLAPADTPGTYYSFGDDGNGPWLYKITGQGRAVGGQIDLATTNTDWESLSRDPQGNYYVGDCGNNESLRRQLVIHKVRPETPGQVQDIAFTYPDQTAFPPKKKQRNFDCEASLWHEGQVWLFTKDRGQQATSKVYAVPDQPGTYVAKLVAKIAIPGEVTDAALAPSGRRLVLLGRSELFVLDGSTWAEILRATPRHIGLPGAGQTEGAVFKDEKTLLISTEQGALYEYVLP